MSRVSMGEARVTVSFRLSKPQLNLLDSYTELYQQGRGELMREAVQVWLNKQLDAHPLPKQAEAPDAVS